jgi:hypothetical protein
VALLFRDKKIAQWSVSSGAIDFREAEDEQFHQITVSFWPGHAGLISGISPDFHREIHFCQEEYWDSNLKFFQVASTHNRPPVPRPRL